MIFREQNCHFLKIGRIYIHAGYLYIYFLLSQRMPEYPGRHVQRYPVDPLTTHNPLFKHGEEEQMSTAERLYRAVRVNVASNKSLKLSNF